MQPEAVVIRACSNCLHHMAEHYSYCEDCDCEAFADEYRAECDDTLCIFELEAGYRLLIG
jgi:hypothetical protein